jgi:hypothetical protein
MRGRSGTVTLLFFFLFGMAGFALTAAVKVFERQINEGEFQYANGSSAFRLRVHPHRRELRVPDE